MRSIAEILAKIFLPCLVIGLALSIAWRFCPSQRVRTALQTVAALLFFLPQPLAMLLGDQSVHLLLYRRGVFSFWGCAIAVLLAMRARGRAPGLSSLVRWRTAPVEIARTEAVFTRLRSDNQAKSPAILLTLAIALCAAGIWCGWLLVGDLVLPRITVSGKAEGLRVHRGTRSPSWPSLIIDGAAYDATWDTIGVVRPGMHVDAEIGFASHVILGIRPAGGH